jgi:hypothetical protein
VTVRSKRTSAVHKLVAHPQQDLVRPHVDHVHELAGHPDGVRVAAVVEGDAELEPVNRLGFERQGGEGEGGEDGVMRYSCRAVHNILGVHGWVAAPSSGRHHRGFLLGSLDAYLHGHDTVGTLAALPSIQCLRLWPS